MLMSLGLFVFDVKSLPFSQRERSTSWRWAESGRIGVRPGYQYVGQGEDKITLSGVLTPEITGGRMELDAIRDMADEGKAWVLMQGNGKHQGFWFIDAVQETGSYFFPDGTARKIDFRIDLKRADEGEPDNIGDLAQLADRLLGTSNIA